MSENKVETTTPVSVRVTRLEQQVQALMELLPKQKDGMQSTLDIVNSAATQLTELRSRMSRADSFLSRLDPVLEDIQVRHTALARIITESQDFSIENLEKHILEVKTELLRSTMAPLVESGQLKPTDTIQRDSFIVFAEEKDDGEVTVPRGQYTYDALSQSLSEDVAKQFLGKQPGEVFKVEEGSDRNLRIIEVYQVAQ